MRHLMMMLTALALAACGGGDPESASGSGSNGPAGSGSTAAAGSNAGASSTAGPPTGRRIYVDNDQATPVTVSLGSVRAEVGPWRVAKLEPADGDYSIGGQAFRIAKASRDMVVYNPGRTGRYECHELLYGVENERPRLKETITNTVLFSRHIDFGFGEAFPFEVKDEPYRYKLTKKWREPVDLEQALGLIETEPKVRDADGQATTRAWTLLEDHPFDERVWALARSQVQGIQPSRLAERVVEQRAARDRDATRRERLALPDCGARISLLGQLDRKDGADRRKRVEGGDLDALLEAPAGDDGIGRAAEKAFGGRPLTAPELGKIRAAFDRADEKNRVALCGLFLKRYQGDVAPLAVWASGRKDAVATSGWRWFALAAAQGDGAAALAVLDVPHAAGGELPDETRKVLVTVAVGADAALGVRAARALIAAAEALPEAERARGVYELSTALVHHNAKQAGALASAVELGAMGVRLLAAANAKARDAAGGLIATAVQHTRDPKLVAALRKAAASERDPQVKATLEQRARYLETVVGQK